MSDQELRDRREAVVREHMESENLHDFDVTIGTFSHPRYEIVPTGEVFDGEEAVRRYFLETRTAFPDQRNELIALHHADECGDRRVRPQGHPSRPAARDPADGSRVHLPDARPVHLRR